MAYSSTNSRPIPIATCPGNGAGSTIGMSTGTGQNLAGGNGGGTIWAYKSTDPVGTVVGSSYFTDGYNLGMRLMDIVFIQDTGQGSTVGLSIASVSAICTTPTTTPIGGSYGVTLAGSFMHST